LRFRIRDGLKRCPCATGIGPGAAARHVEGRDTGATFKVTFTGVANINIDDASVSLTASGSGLLPRAR